MPETPDLSVLPEKVGPTVDPATIEPFAEAAWFAWRTNERSTLDIRNGVWWNDSGERVISLAVGTDLHAYDSIDYETYPFRGAAEGRAEDVCCHDSREAADACALTFLLTGGFCTDTLEATDAR